MMMNTLESFLAPARVSDWMACAHVRRCPNWQCWWDEDSVVAASGLTEDDERNLQGDKMRSKARARKLAKSRLFCFFSAVLLFVCLLVLLPDSLFRRRQPKLQRVSHVHRRAFLSFVIFFTRGRRRIFCPRLELFWLVLLRQVGSRFPCMHRSWLRCFSRRHKLSCVMRNAAGALPDFAPAGSESPPSEYFSSIFSPSRMCVCSGRVLCRLL